MNKEELQTEQTHIDHEIRVQEVRGCIFVQRGVQMQCDGKNEHSPHGFYIPAEYVFRRQTDKGLVFENLKTGKEELKLPPIER